MGINMGIDMFVPFFNDHMLPYAMKMWSGTWSVTPARLWSWESGASPGRDALKVRG